MIKLFSLLFILSFLFSSIHASVTFSSSIIPLTASNFLTGESIHRSNKIVLVAFYSQSCGPICTQIVNEYNKAAKALSSMIVTASVDCSSEIELCKKYSIDSPPAKPLFYSFRHPSPPTPYPHPIENIDAKAIVTFALSSLPNDFVTRLKHDNLPHFIELRKVSTLAIYFTDKKPLSSVIKAASYHYAGHISFAEVKHTETKIVDIYSSVTGRKYPSLVILPFGSHETLVYSGSLEANSYNELINYLSQFHSKKINAEIHASGETKLSGNNNNPINNNNNDYDGGEAPEPTYEQNHPLTEEELLQRSKEPRIPAITWSSQPYPEDGGLINDITPDNYDILILNRQTPWLLLFYSSEEEQLKGLTSILNDFTRAASRVSNEVRFGLIDLSHYPSLRSIFSVPRTPVIRTVIDRFPLPRDPLNTHNYNGDSSVEGLQRYISTSLLRNAPVTSVSSVSLIGFVTAQSFDYNPLYNYQNSPRVLFINMLNEVPDLLRALSFEFDGRYVFGMAHYTDSGIISQFNVKEVPSLFLITMIPDENDQSNKTKKMKVHPYKGPLYFNALYAFLNKFKP